ncbi:MAG: hypothetical protein RIR70_61 [Pseudomonadota bacterium]|jgi:virginiamycin B lyase
MKFAHSLTALLVACCLALPARAVDIDARLPGNRFMEIRLPNADGSTHDLAAGPDGNVWVTQIAPAQLVRVTPISETRRYPLPKASAPHGIVFDQAGRLWVSLEARHTLAQVDMKTGRVLKEFSLSNENHREIGPHGLAVGKDGKTLWFAGKSGNVVGKLNPDTGEVTLYPLPNPDSKPIYVSPDREGNVWYTALEGAAVGFVNPDGFMFEFPVPEGSGRPITIVPDPNLPLMWFSLENGGLFASVDVAGNMSAYSVSKANMKLAGLGFDGAGQLWLTAQSPDMIALVKKDMSITEWPLPTERAVLHRIILGPQGNMWFTELAKDKVGYVVDTAGYGK